MTDCELSERGIRQISFKLTRKHKDIATVGKKPIKVVFCSPLKRSIRTAMAFPYVNKIVVIPGLSEIRPLAGMNIKQMKAWMFNQCIDSNLFDLTMLKNTPEWQKQFKKETEKEAQQRISKALTTVSKQQKNKSIAIVSHKNTINMCLGRYTYPFKTKKQRNPQLPKGWGFHRGFPANFKPFRVKFKSLKNGMGLVSGKGHILLIRHAHSINNANH